MQVEGETSGPYELSCELSGHEKDVRTVLALDSDTLLSGSRDNSVRVWKRAENKAKPFVQDKILIGHQHWVSALSRFYPSETPDKAISFASGGYDKIINIWNLDFSPEPVGTLIGHNGWVCALSASPSHADTLVSGSSDKTIRVWKHGACEAILEGHKETVWAVLLLSNGDVVSGSADKTIKIWRDNKCIKTLEGHLDAVRSLTLLNNIGFLSCGNDGTVKLWSFSGDLLQDIQGHSEFIYSIASLGDCTVTSSEDRSVKFWKGNECVQVIIHPSTVWSAAFLPNEDIISGCSDGIMRVWTKDASRMATEELRKVYDSALLDNAINSIDPNKLPAVSSLSTPGSSDGQTKIVRNGNVVECYQWNAEQGEWLKVGDVVNAVDDSKTLDGKKYDHVFEIDLGDEAPMKKIGMNDGDDPWMVAQEFLNKEDLSQFYLDQVANFLAKNVKPVTIGEAPPVYSDPFTGSNRYIPGQSSSQNPPAAVPMDIEKPSPPQKTQTNEYFPQRNFIFFSANQQIGAARKKILEFNQQFVKEKEKHSYHLIEEEVNVVSSLTTKLESSKPEVISDQEVKVLWKLLSWPPEFIFPAYDLARLVLLNTFAARKLLKDFSVLIPSLISDLSKSAPAPNQMLALRIFANMFNNLVDVVVVNEEKITNHLPEVNMGNKNAVLSVATFVFNLSVYFLDHRPTFERKTQLIALISELLPQDLENETTLRLLVALGNLVYQDDTCQKLSKELGVGDLVKKYLKSSDQRVSGCASSLSFVLS